MNNDRKEPEQWYAFFKPRPEEDNTKNVEIIPPVPQQPAPARLPYYR